MSVTPLITRSQAHPQFPFSLPSCENWLCDCFRLRYEYFVQQRNWVADQFRESRLEVDIYDWTAWHLACADAYGVCAYLRAVPSTSSTGFMLEHEFASLLSPEELLNLERVDALELSRLTLRSDITLRGQPDQPHPIEHLLKALYREAKGSSYRHFHIVVEPKWLPALDRRFGLPFRMIGQIYTFPDGTHTVAATTTIEELEEGMKRHSRAKYDWYQCFEDK